MVGMRAAPQLIVKSGEILEQVGLRSCADPPGVFGPERLPVGVEGGDPVAQRIPRELLPEIRVKRFVIR